MGRHQNRVDAKGRVSIPAPFRKVIASLALPDTAPLVLVPSYTHPCIEGWTAHEFARLEAPLNQLHTFSADHDALTAALYADAVPVESDKEGRIMLPDHLATHAGIGEAVMFVGMGRRFQIWEPDAAIADRAAKLRHASEQRLTLPGGIPA